MPYCIAIYNHIWCDSILKLVKFIFDCYSFSFNRKSYQHICHAYGKPVIFNVSANSNKILSFTSVWTTLSMPCPDPNFVKNVNFWTISNQDINLDRYSKLAQMIFQYILKTALPQILARTQNPLFHIFMRNC